mmetsp:Transcript_128035/g.398711  ORF Transcript_128035/g.398711 Transcript_128035/m.398711 type:complete len:268 (+) Transcript_128035:568-1371(+)
MPPRLRLGQERHQDCGSQGRGGALLQGDGVGCDQPRPRLPLQGDRGRAPPRQGEAAAGGRRGRERHRHHQRRQRGHVVRHLPKRPTRRLQGQGRGHFQEDGQRGCRRRAPEGHQRRRGHRPGSGAEARPRQYHGHLHGQQRGRRLREQGRQPHGMDQRALLHQVGPEPRRADGPLDKGVPHWCIPHVLGPARCHEAGGQGRRQVTGGVRLPPPRHVHHQARGPRPVPEAHPEGHGGPFPGAPGEEALRDGRGVPGLRLGAVLRVLPH